MDSTEEIDSIRSYRITVFLVDDQPLIAEAVRRALLGEDIDFHYCRNPMDAVQMATELRPTIILQDLIMPEIDGLSMVKIYRADPVLKNVPILVLSTKEEPEVKSKAFEFGANDYIVKLPDQMELIARIRYHSQAYINQKQRDEAFKALLISQRQLAEANANLQKLSSLDGLTGISNRRRFDEVLKAEWQRAIRHCTSISLILLDIDFFKLFNDAYGHQRGDDCLKQVARVLEESIQRETDVVARYGGEEFAVILPETGTKGAYEVAERIRFNLEQQNICHECSTISDHVTISAGVATSIPEKGTQPDELIFLADQSLYRAKEKGRNRVISTVMKVNGS